MHATHKHINTHARTRTHAQNTRLCNPPHFSHPHTHSARPPSKRTATPTQRPCTRCSHLWMRWPTGRSWPQVGQLQAPLCSLPHSRCVYVCVIACASCSLNIAGCNLCTHEWRRLEQQPFALLGQCQRGMRSQLLLVRCHGLYSNSVCT